MGPQGRQRGRVSVIVAVLNARDTIQACIDSVVGQRDADCELIVFDGASDDGTVAVLEANARHFAYWESRPDRGLYDAWNKALAHTTGEWVSFLGADDTFATDHAVATLLAAAEPETNLVFGKLEVVRDGEVTRVQGKPWDFDELKRAQFVAHSGALHARSLFDVFGKFDQRYSIAGDYDFLLRVGRAARPAFTDTVIVRFASSGLSSRQYVRAIGESRQIQARHPEIGPTAAWKNYLEDRARHEVRQRIPAAVRAGVMRVARRILA